MLRRKLQEPLAAISKETREAEESLFLHLEELARNRPFLLDCTVQQLADDEFVAVLLDHDSGAKSVHGREPLMASSSNSKRASTRSTRVWHMPLLRLSVMPNISRALRTIQHCGKASDLADHRRPERNEAQSLAQFLLSSRPSG